jgi:hypothetical protein
MALSVVGVNLPQLHKAALAAGLNERGEADAKEASRLYKEGDYESAAHILAKLSVDYPDMEIFDRQVGACFYHLGKPEPALSNLRRYLSRKKGIAPDDKAVVDRWIDEMEKLHAQNVAASVPPAALLAPVEPAPRVPSATGEPSVSLPPQVSPTSQTKGEETGQGGIDQASEAHHLTTKSGKDANTPPGLALSANPGTSTSTEAGQPIYKTWWFWTGAAAVVAASTVAAILIAGRSSSPCSGASLSCMEVK